MQSKHQKPYLLVTLLLIFVLAVGIIINQQVMPYGTTTNNAQANFNSSNGLDKFELTVADTTPGATTSYTFRLHTKAEIQSSSTSYATFRFLSVLPNQVGTVGDYDIPVTSFTGATVDLLGSEYFTTSDAPSGNYLALRISKAIPANTDLTIKLNNVKNPTTPGVYYIYANNDYLSQSSPVVIGTPNVIGSAYYLNGAPSDVYLTLKNTSSGTIYRTQPYHGVYLSLSSRTGSGSFKFVNIPAGQYIAMVGNGTGLSFGNHYGFFPGPKTITVPSSGSVEVNFQFTQYPPQNDRRPKEIKGKLITDTGLPAGGIALTFDTYGHPGDQHLGSYEVTTNSSGEFTTSTSGGRDIVAYAPRSFVECAAARTQHAALIDGTIPVVAMFNEDSTYESKTVELRIATSCLPEWNKPFESTSAGQAYIAASASAAAASNSSPSATATPTSTATTSSSTSSAAKVDKEATNITKDNKLSTATSSAETEKFVKQSVDCIQGIVSRSRFNLISKGKARPTVEEAVRAFDCFVNGFVPESLAPVDPEKIETIAKASAESASIATPEVTHDTQSNPNNSSSGAPATTTKVKLSGQVVDKKNSQIFLYVFSQPKVYTVKTDNEGRWSYTLTDALEAGEHKVYLAYSKSKNNLVASEPIKFTVTKPEPTATPTISPTTSPEESSALTVATSQNGKKSTTESSARTSAFIQWLTNPFTLSSIIVLVGVVLFRLWRRTRHLRA